MREIFSPRKTRFTLPIWVAAAARAATQVLIGMSFQSEQELCIPNEKKKISVSVASAAKVGTCDGALGISFCHSGLGLDLTQGLEAWVYVQWDEEHIYSNALEASQIENNHQFFSLVPGTGVGRYQVDGSICASKFAYDLLKINLRPLVPIGRYLRLEVVFPKGSDLAARTSNESFGVVDGLSLIGITAEAQVSASPEQLNKNLEKLASITDHKGFDGFLTLVIGENGLDLAASTGLNVHPILKTGNWVGPLLIAAAKANVKQLVLFGYHGKLIKLAGGIFHTHHHLADARLEILSALALRTGLPVDLIKSLISSDSVEHAFKTLTSIDPLLSKRLWEQLAGEVERRSSEYVKRYCASKMSIGSVLFDRSRKVRRVGPVGLEQLSSLGIRSLCSS
ncbi:cobalt-precorrin-5B (C(1))-methyltransferase CbiD [Prochlorococcus sp. MIT 1300]|uniref:cobalt-precorrin-5B (C(1))-methyltransferase CbiD n=1 Tax=Prochlorococcus sp. MIT 1300 TaxID=3096218 RepID=UPI002A74D201|nr:cobalt-precorrin-5B (C(1))-methyltransferase CbiD [Prochlorococcus sp. MIT 1300]